MKDLIKEVALEVSERLVGSYLLDSNQEYSEEFATAFLAELSKQCGPIYQICKSDSASLSSAWIDVDRQTYADAGLYPEYGRRMLFTFPPIHDIEAIENRVAEACAKAVDRRWGGAQLIRSGEWRKYK